MMTHDKSTKDNSQACYITRDKWQGHDDDDDDDDDKKLEGEAG